MASPVPRIDRRMLAVIGLGLLVASIAWIGGDSVAAAIARCSPRAIAAATMAIVIATVLGAWNSYRICELQSVLPFPAYLRLYWRSWAIGITLPGQVGDVLSTLWQLKGRTIDLNFIAGRLVVDKAITLGVILALLTSLPLMIGRARAVASTGLLLALAGAAVIGYALLKWCERNPERVQRLPMGARLAPLLTGLQTPWPLVAANFAVTCLKTLLSGFAYWQVLGSIAPSRPTLVATTVISQSAGLVAYVPISFNGLGTVELSAVTLFGAVGLASATVLSAYLILRTMTLTAAWLPALAISMQGPAPRAG